MKDAKQKTAEAKAFVEEQVAERERIRTAKEKMKVQITKAIKIQVCIFSGVRLNLKIVII
jgi:hypothetical protein